MRYLLRKLLLLIWARKELRDIVESLNANTNEWDAVSIDDTEKLQLVHKAGRVAIDNLMVEKSKFLVHIDGEQLSELTDFENYVLAKSILELADKKRAEIVAKLIADVVETVKSCSPQS